MRGEGSSPGGEGAIGKFFFLNSLGCFFFFYTLFRGVNGANEVLDISGERGNCPG